MHRGWYTAFYVLFLVMLAVTLWFLLFYANVPSWVWIFFGVAILIAIIGVIIKETLLKTIKTPCGEVISGPSPFWSGMYLIFHIFAFILIVIGLVFTIQYSNIPSWIWIVLGLALLFYIIATMILAFIPTAHIWYFLTMVVAIILLLTGVISAIIASNAPAWIWALIAVTILFGLIAALLEPASDYNEVIIEGDAIPQAISFGQALLPVSLGDCKIQVTRCFENEKGEKVCESTVEASPCPSKCKQTVTKCFENERGERVCESAVEAAPCPSRCNQLVTRCFENEKGERICESSKQPVKCPDPVCKETITTCFEGEDGQRQCKSEVRDVPCRKTCNNPIVKPVCTKPACNKPSCANPTYTRQTFVQQPIVAQPVVVQPVAVQQPVIVQQPTIVQQPQFILRSTPNLPPHQLNPISTFLPGMNVNQY